MAFVARSLLVVGLTALARADIASESPALAARVASLEGEVERLRGVETEMERLRNEMQELRSLLSSSTSGVAKDQGRRLTGAGGGSSTHVSVPSRVVHEFASGHSCGSVSGYMRSLPVKADGAVTYQPSPSDVTDGEQLSKVASDWSTTSIVGHTAPLKLIHDASCAHEPVLRLGLNVSMPTLNVDGLGDLAAIVSTVTLALAAPTSWSSLPLNTAKASTSGSACGGSDSYACATYAVHNGFVHMVGKVEPVGTHFTAGDVIATMPTGARVSTSSGDRAFVVAAYSTTSVANGGWRYARLKLTASTGELSVLSVQGSGTTGIHLDGLSYAAEA